MLAIAQGSANFWGSRAGWAPKELAAGRTGKFYVKKINNCGLAHPPHHDVMSYICKSTERKRGDSWYFVQDCCEINFTSFQLYTIFFQLHRKCPNFIRLVTKGSSVRESVSVSVNSSTSVRELISVDYQCATKSRSAWKQSLIVRYVFRAEFTVKTNEPPRAGWMELAGRIWPAGRTLPTPDLT